MCGFSLICSQKTVWAVGCAQCDQKVCEKATQNIFKSPIAYVHVVPTQELFT
jgi:hypothetical protein